MADALLSFLRPESELAAKKSRRSLRAADDDSDTDLPIRILRAIRDEGPTAVAELSRAFQRPLMEVALHITSLQDEGLIHRVEADGTPHIEVTEKGKDTLSVLGY